MRRTLRRMSAAARARMGEWILRRQGRDTDGVVLRRGRIYILPTGLGLEASAAVEARARPLM